MTVAELIAQLQRMPQDKPVKVWLPGSRISLERVLTFHDEGVLIEGNVDSGSALS